MDVAKAQAELSESNPGGVFTTRRSTRAMRNNRRATITAATSLALANHTGELSADKRRVQSH